MMIRKIAAATAAITMLTSSYATAAAERWIRVVNERAAYPIFYVYITPAGQSTWGSDQLGGSVLAAGGSHTWNIPWDGCRVDLRAVTFTGLSAEQRNVDICGGGVWTLYD